MTTVFTGADFERLSCHDCHIWGIDLRPGDPETGDWSSDLALDIDFITEWVTTEDRRFHFRVAPASLVFHDVTDPRIVIDSGSTGFQVALQPVPIERIERRAIGNQKVCLDRPYFRSHVALNTLGGGAIEFGATGFTQTPRADPFLTKQQNLTRALLRRLEKDSSSPQ